MPVNEKKNWMIETIFLHFLLGIDVNDKENEKRIPWWKKGKLFFNRSSSSNFSNSSNSSRNKKTNWLTEFTTTISIARNPTHLEKNLQSLFFLEGNC